MRSAKVPNVLPDAATGVDTEMSKVTADEPNGGYDQEKPSFEPPSPCNLIDLSADCIMRLTLYLGTDFIFSSCRSSPSAD